MKFSFSTFLLASILAAVMTATAATSCATKPNTEGFKTENFSKKVETLSLKVDYPVAGNPRLLQGIRDWLNSSLGGTYKGNLDNAEAFFSHYASGLGKEDWVTDCKRFGVPFEGIKEFKMDYKNDRIVTYIYSFYQYSGGAHGIGQTVGTTFLGTDGSKFTSQCFKDSYAGMHYAFVKGLKQYFKVSSDSELMKHLFASSTRDIPNPTVQPWIEEDGVVFTYSDYEIAPYSEGQPTFTIPFSEVREFLTPEGLAFIPEE